MRVAEIFLVFFGCILIYFEFLLPGAVMGLLGSGLLFFGLVLTFVHGESFVFIGLYLSAIVLGVIFAISLALWSIKRKKIFHKEDQEGSHAGLSNENLIGKVGVVETDLKPSGYVMIEGSSYQAISKSGYLEKGIVVEVMSWEENHIIVRRKV
ncbi:MAG: NfeD family protein [Chlamydiota bacterium]